MESIHWGHVLIADAEGRTLASYGDEDRVVYMRSSSKPIQALAVVMSGAADQFAFTERELAICCASHHGRPEHVETVLSILDKIGLGPEALQCGVHEPADAEARRQLCLRGEKPSPLHNNCSGKHAGMLATCRAMGWPVDDYIKPEHPRQRWHRQNVALACGMREDDVVLGVDGCGVPTFGVPLRCVAVSFARLASGSGLPEEMASAAKRVREAMWAAPELISGPGVFHSELLAAGRGRIVAKGGAEGLMPVGSVSEAMGFALRIDDGSGRALAPATLAVIEGLGWLEGDEMQRWRLPAVHNAHGWQVGVIRPAKELVDWIESLPIG